MSKSCERPAQGSIDAAGNSLRSTRPIMCNSFLTPAPAGAPPNASVPLLQHGAQPEEMPAIPGCELIYFFVLYCMPATVLYGECIVCPSSWRAAERLGSIVAARGTTRENARHPRGCELIYFIVLYCMRAKNCMRATILYGSCIVCPPRRRAAERLCATVAPRSAT